MTKNRNIKLIAWLGTIAALCIAGMFLQPYTTEKTVDAGVVINELMSENSACAPHNGLFSDWIEIKNISDGIVSLDGMRVISDTKSKKVFTVPGITLEPGEMTLIFCQGSAGVRDELSAGFTLSPTGGTVVLLDKNFDIVDEAVYPAMTSGQTYARGENGEFAVTDEFTPYLDNTSENHLSIINAEPEPGAAVISAVCADPIEGGDTVTLRNISSEKLSLDGWYLSDKRLNLTKLRLPNVTLAPGEETVIEPAGAFSLKSGGESLYLTDPSGAIRSAVSWENMGKGVSLVWTGSGYATSASALTGKPQNDIYISEAAVRLVGLNDFIEVSNRSSSDIDVSGYGLSDDVEHPRKWTFPDNTVIPAGGEYCLQLNDEKLFRLKGDGSETVVLALPDGTIIDTLSTAGMRVNTSVGRDPDTLASVFYRTPTPGTRNGAGLIDILPEVTFSHDGGNTDEEMLSVSLFSSEGATIFYTLDGSEPTKNSSVYSEPIIISSDTVIRAVQWREDAIESIPASRTYIFEKQHTLPIVAVTGDASQILGGNGILKTGSKSVTPVVSAEFYSADGTLLADQLLEMKMVGHQSRTTFPNKAFKLTARAEYGSSRISADLFEARGYDEYKSVVLRASGQDYKQTRMRDSILASLADEMGLYSQASTPCAVYVNAKYIGHYNLRERVSIQSIAQFEGWEDPDAVELIEGTDYRAVNGSASSFRALMNNMSGADFTKESDLRKLESIVDIDNYLDYVALMMYTADKDLDNLKVYRSTEGGNRFKWVVFDMDLSYTTDLDSPSEWLKSGGVGSITEQDNTMFVKLMKNPDIRARFLTRMGELLNTVFSADNVVGKITERYELISDEMKYHTELWGWSYDTWIQNVKSMASYAQSRPDKLRGYLIGAFGLTDAEAVEYFG